MSDTATTPSQSQNDYLVGGSNYTFKPGVNHGVKIKGWSIEKNENNGKTSRYLKIVYVHPQPQVDESDWSTMNELLNFPGFPLNKTEINKKTVQYGFMNPLTGFIMNFATKDQVNERILAVFAKLGTNEFNLTDEAVAHTQFETMVQGLFNLVEDKGLFQLDGTLICGYGAPKESNGETKQYLTPGKYGTGSVYKPAFRTSNDEELYPEKTGNFKDDTDKKYSFWSYKRTSSNSNQSSQQAATTTNAATDDTW